MNKLDGNKYLCKRGTSREVSFDAFLFDSVAPRQRVGAERFLSAVRELVVSLGFKVQYSGCKYLTRLVKHYLVLREYDESAVIERIADFYAVTVDKVYANILSVLEMNKIFIPRATELLNVPQDSIRNNDIGDAVEAIGALFKIFYNLETDEDDTSDEVRKAFDWERLFAHGK